MKRIIAALLVFVLLITLLSGCAGKDTAPAADESPQSAPEATPAEPTTAPTAEPTAEPVEEPEAERDRSRDLSWKRAFRDNSLPDGSLSPEEVAFYEPRDEGGALIHNVAKEELQHWASEQKNLPRTHYYEQFMAENLQELYPVLDYAMAHGYSRASVPTTAFSGQDVAYAAPYLRLSYRINESGIGALSVAAFPLEDGSELQYVLLTLPGMDSRGRISQYREGIAAARDIVAQIPEGSGEYEKVLFLYSWLTEHVRYDNNDYYEQGWSLLYDTLVKRSTVCTGYAEAFYVMCNLAGVDCLTVSGLMQGGIYGHIWNVARVDGIWYMFDATWDGGAAPERYRFFGVTEESLAAYDKRYMETLAQEYCPKCTETLPRPGGGNGAALDSLKPGVLENGRYRQDFADLTLQVADSWTVLSRKELAETYYSDARVETMQIRELLEQGAPYLDLVLNRGHSVVQILLEANPVQLASGDYVRTAAEYMDGLEETMKTLYATSLGQGVIKMKSERFPYSIGEREYRVLRMQLNAGGEQMTQTFLCFEESGVFLTISIACDNEADDAILLELLGDGS